MIWLVIHVSLSNLDIIGLSWNLFYIDYRKFSTLYTFTVNLITLFIFSFCDLHLIVSYCCFKKKILHFIGIYSKYAHQCGDPKILQSPLSIDSHFSLRVFSLWWFFIDHFLLQSASLWIHPFHHPCLQNCLIKTIESYLHPYHLPFHCSLYSCSYHLHFQNDFTCHLPFHHQNLLQRNHRYHQILPFIQNYSFHHPCLQSHLQMDDCFCSYLTISFLFHLINQIHYH